MEKLFTSIQENTNLISTIAAMISAIAATISVVVIAISLRNQRRHNIASVTPIAYINPINYEDSIAVEILNSGTGPLVITQFEAKDKNGRSENNLIGLMPELPNGIYWATFFEYLKNFSIIPSHSLTLLKFSGNIEDPDFCKVRDTIRKRLSDIEITLTYRDIYGREMPKVHKGLEWFARRK
jgi:hypothetical protein